MITLKIENEMLEKIYYDEFGGDEKAFTDFLQEAVVANNVEYEEDLSHLQSIVDEAMKSPIVEKSHKEIWEDLTKKYG